MSKTSGPQTFATEQFHDAAEAVARLHAIYDANTGLLRDAFRAYSRGEEPAARVRACYPYLSVRVEDFSRADTRLSYGFVDRPGTFSTTITRPSLFHRYLTEQVGQIIHNHHVPVEVGVSDTPIPIHFAFPDGMHVEGDLTRERMLHMRALRAPDAAGRALRAPALLRAAAGRGGPAPGTPGDLCRGRG